MVAKTSGVAVSFDLVNLPFLFRAILHVSSAAELQSIQVGFLFIYEYAYLYEHSSRFPHLLCLSGLVLFAHEQLSQGSTPMLKLSSFNGMSAMTVN